VKQNVLFYSFWFEKIFPCKTERSFLTFLG
jgi:hypothetical protein